MILIDAGARTSRQAFTRKYALKILERASMFNCHPCRTPVDTETKLGANGILACDPTLYRSLADYGLQLYSSSLISLVAIFRYADWQQLTLQEKRDIIVELEYIGIRGAVLFRKSTRDVRGYMHRRSTLTSFSAFKIVLDGDRDNIPALFGQVRVSDSTLHDHVPEYQSKNRLEVIALDVDLPVKQAFHILYEQLGNHGSNLTEEELETHTTSAWKEAKLYLLKQSTKHGKIFSKLLVQAGPDENLKDITLKILQNRVATLPITHSTSDDGSYPQYFRHSASSLPILQLPICSLPLGTWVPKIGESNRQPLAILRPNSSLSAALNLFVQGIESCDKDIQGSQDHSGRIDEERNGESMLWPEVAGKGRYFKLDPDTSRAVL
ncbi:hypothetical protein Tco_0965672 [Tanacetum coccineum]